MNELGFYLKWKCVNCENKYGELPYSCGLCGCNRFVEIEPEFYSLEHKNKNNERSKHNNQRQSEESRKH